MTSERQNGESRRANAGGASDAGGRRPWQRPTLTAYGPIGKLTQGGTGGRQDGTASKRR